MKIKEYILMSLKDLWRRKGRTILTALGITIGTLLIVTMMGIVVGLKGFMSDAINDSDSARIINVNHYRDYTNDEEAYEDITNDEKFEEKYYKKIDDELIDKMKDTGKVEAVVAEIGYNPHSIIFNNKEYTGSIRGVGYNLGANIYADSVVERVRHDEKNDSLKPLSHGEFISKESGQALIGEKLLESLELSSDDVLNKEIEVSAISNIKVNGTKLTKKVTVVGIIDGHFNNSNALVLSSYDIAELKGYGTLQKDYFENKGYDSMEVLVSNLSDVESVDNTIKDLDYYRMSSIDAAKQIESSMGAMNKGFLILGIIVLFVAAIGIINTMGMAVAERTKSIGVMKSVGASSSTIRLMFLIQASLIGLIGGIFGVLIGSGVNSIIEVFAKSKISDSGVKLSISIGLPWYWIATILLFSMVIALVSGIYPASKAAKLDPVEALRR
ncbi:putative ABC transport system permease protein [Clostridium sp. DSM 8431]|uniref:ABC transporter permease n=1 Tax=Clostridium sp. DSM 8431 TaxID=1761781 RepID=UPI0008EB7569|nr:FtsX-like permease family protein [Clostridium sp. DSM 8431]SFU57715.1 putative ABC transport system permease protein [Clostridium sp. DSM 8431]